jgi:hypothetical protein
MMFKLFKRFDHWSEKLINKAIEEDQTLDGFFGFIIPLHSSILGLTVVLWLMGAFDEEASVSLLECLLGIVLGLLLAVPIFVIYTLAVVALALLPVYFRKHRRDS